MVSNNKWFYAELLAYSLLLEASGHPKPGNVSPHRSLPGLRYEDFLYTGIASVKWFRRGIIRGFRGWGRIVFGDLVYGVINDSVSFHGSNTCLGSALLLAPLSIGIGRCFRRGIISTNCFLEEATNSVRNTTVYDTIYFYKAVRIASPSYIKLTDDTGEYVNVWDNRYKAKLLEKNHKLYSVLKYSASKGDLVSDELISGYRRSVSGKSFFHERISTHKDWNRGVVEVYLYHLSKNPDTIVLRKYGERKAHDLMRRARKVLEKIIRAKNDKWYEFVEKLDRDLRRENINPGSIADLTVSTLALYLLEYRGIKY